jgi:hypothetical protein
VTVKVRARRRARRTARFGSSWLDCVRLQRKDPTKRCGPVVRATNVRDGGAATAASQHQCVKRFAVPREPSCALITLGGGKRAHEPP